MKNYERDEEFFYLIYMRIDQKRPNLLKAQKVLAADRWPIGYMLLQRALAQSCLPSVVFILHRPKSTSGVPCRLGDNSSTSVTLKYQHVKC